MFEYLDATSKHLNTWRSVGAVVGSHGCPDQPWRFPTGGPCAGLRRRAAIWGSPEFRPRGERPILRVNDVTMSSDATSSIAGKTTHHPHRDTTTHPRCSLARCGSPPPHARWHRRGRIQDGRDRIDRRGRLHDPRGADRQLGLPDHDPQAARPRGVGPGRHVLPRAHPRLSERVEFRRQLSEARLGRPRAAPGVPRRGQWIITSHVRAIAVEASPTGAPC